MYAAFAFGFAAKTYTKRDQLIQNKALTTICDTDQFVKHSQLHRDMKMKIIKKFTEQIKRKLNK